MEDNGPLLYDLLEIKEWDPVEEEVKVSKGSSFSLLNFVPGLGRGTKRNLNGVILPSWEIVISRDETRLAILSDSFLEIYSVPETLIGRSKCFDEAMGRQVIWSRDSDYILVPSDNGKKFFLYDGFSAHLIYQIFSPSWSGTTSPIFIDFLGPPPQSTWTDQVLAISDKGKGISFLIGKTGFQEFANFSFGVKDVCCAVHSKKYNLNVIAYWNPSHSLYVLGVWRPLNEEPYFQKVDTHTEGSDVHPILKMSLSHCESKILTLDTEGSLKIYQIPTLSLLFISLLSEQPLFDEINPSLLQDPKLVSRKNDFLNSSVKWHPYQVEWWDKDAVIISRFSGSVSIITVESGKESRNLLGDSVEFFSDIPCITPRFGRYIFCLERDYEETQDNEVNEPVKKSWSWNFSDKNKNKRIISNYRLIAMVKMTPEELYQRKIDKEEYGEALVLAEVFGLDSDLVYLRRWHLSDFSIIAQNDFLYKVGKISTVTQECLDTVPSDIYAAKELLQFGLKTVQAEKIINHDYEEKFMKYIKLLKTYERLIRSFGRQEIKFNSHFFLKFRDMSIKESIRNFAQLGYWDSIRVLFEMHFEEISDDYIDLISSFPESYSPLEYSFILPFADLKTKNVIYPFGDLSLNLNRLSFDALQNWYNSRSSAIEQATGLPDNAIDLLEFAQMHGVDIDEEYYLDLITLRTIIYDLGKTDMNYAKFKRMSNAQKVDLFILCENDKEKVLVSPRIQEYLIPFLELQDKINIGSYNTILKDYFSRSRPREISFDKEIIFNLPERKIKDINFISLCLDSLFQLNDDYDTLCEILLLFMEHKSLNILNEVYSIMNINVITNKYGYSKSMKLGCQDYKDVEYIDTVIEDLCRNANFLQHIENPELASKALDDIFTICKSNSQIDLNKYFESTLVQLLRSENNKIVTLIVESLECFSFASGKKCESCFYHKALKNYDLMDLTLAQKEQILLSTAEYYLEESNFIGDHNVSLAELCLKKLSPEDKQVKNLRNVLRVGYHLNDFSIQASPSYINNSENVKCIIRDILTKNKNNYKKYSEILLIASCLCTEDRFLRETEEMIAKYSLEAEDIRHALVMVKNMIQHSYEPAAELCFDILKCAPHMSIEDRELLNNFCLQFGEPSHVLNLLDEMEASHEYLKDFSMPKESSHSEFNQFIFHPFYDNHPGLGNQIELWSLSKGPIDTSSIHSWINNFMGYDILGAISLMASVMGDTKWNEDKDEKNYLFIKAYVASIQAFSSLLRADVLLIPPKILISAAIEEAKTVNNHPIQAVMSKFNNYIEARRLYDVDSNIDVVRFVNDETYKLDTILGLSMSSDAHSFNLAMKYAQQNEGIDKWKLCFNFLMSVFDEDPSQVSEILNNNPKVSQILKENPHKLLQNLRKYIYQSLNGKNYELMLMYFRILLSFDLISESELKQYKKLIMKTKALCTSTFQMDLKEVLGDPDVFCTTIKSIIESSSLEKIISLTEVLTKINPNANRGLIYQSLCEKYFESGMNKGLSIEQIFEQCEEYFKEMSKQQLKEFVIFVGFKSQTISLDFSDREFFLVHLKKWVQENELLSDIDLWIQHNSNLRELEVHSSEFLFDLGNTLGDHEEIKQLITQRVVEGKDSFKELIPILEKLTSYRKEEVFIQIISDFLGSKTPKISTLESILLDYDLINDEEEIDKIHRLLIDWCMKDEESKSLDIKYVVINFVRKKSDDQNALDAISLHKSRLILAKKFSNVESLLPNLNNKFQFLEQMTDEGKLTPHNVSAILELIYFWEEDEKEFMEIKSTILKFIIRQKIGQSFTQDLHKFSLHHLPNIKEILDICYSKKEVKFAFELLKHCSVENKEMEETVQKLEAKYPLTFSTLEPSSHWNFDFSMPFSLWMERRVQS